MYGSLDKIYRSLESREELLSPFAARSRLSKGRAKPEKPSPVRLEFQRDRDRIIHCNSFRRLKHKTQVFITPIGDHYVTRLTHTLEVAQIARTISRALNINEDLTEAIALGHDLGHTPFGHVGEEVLNELYPEGFRHNEQSLRIVELLENNRQGLNLTWEVKDGIVNHSKTGVIDILGKDWGQSGTWEGEVCKLADVVAYINHDIDDAIRAGIITREDLPSSTVKILGNNRSERINTMVCDIIENSISIRGEKPLEKPFLKMSQSIREACVELHEFLHLKVYHAVAIEPDNTKARKIVRFLYNFLVSHPAMLPVEYSSVQEDVSRCVVDYIAGMTDYFAIRKAEEFGYSET